MPMLFPNFGGGPGAGGGGGVTATFTATVSSGTVGSDLTDYLLRIDLSNMPAAFWTNVHETGANVRVYSDSGLTTAIPFHIAHLDVGNQEGWLNVKRDLAAASDTVAYIAITSDTARPAATDANGSQAVYSPFLAAIVSAWRPFNEADGLGLSSSGDPTMLAQAQFTASALTGHDAAERTPNGLWVTVADNGTLRLYSAVDTSPVLEATYDPKSDIETLLSFTGGSLNEASGITRHPGNGFYYMMVGGGGNNSLARIDIDDVAMTMSLSTAFDKTGETLGISDLTARRNGDDTWTLYGSVFATSGAGGSNILRRLDPTDGSTLTDFTHDHNYVEAQGIAWVEPAQCFWLSDNSDNALFAVDITGKSTVLGMAGASLNVLQSVTYHDGSLYVFASSTTTGHIHKFTPRSIALAGGAAINNDGGANQFFSQTISSATTVTMMATVLFDAGSGFRPYFGYVDAGTSNHIHMRSSGISTLQAWDGSDPGVGTVVASNGVAYRTVGTMNSGGTTEFYLNGAFDTSGAASAMPSAMDRLVLANDWDDDASLNGALAQVFLANTKLTADWIAADYDNLNAPATFVTLAAA